MVTGTLGQQHQAERHGWRPFSWWADRLQFGRKVGSGALYHCPVHEDDDASLKLDEDPKGNGLIYCHAGCMYSEILAAVEGIDPSPKVETPAVEPVAQNSDNHKGTEKPSGPRIVFKKREESGWRKWSAYTLIPKEAWEKIGVKVVGNEVIFGWPSLGVEKRRTIGEKKFRWTSGTRPPLWPEQPVTLPETIYISEGESDCGVLRHLGVISFAKVKGANTKLSSAVFEAPKARGVRTVVLVPDADEPGVEGAQVDSATAQRVGLHVEIVKISRLVDPLYGEKDLLDAYRRTDDPFALRRAIHAATVPIPETHLRRRQGMDDLPDELPPVEWLIERVIELGGVGAFVGDGGVGKTWFLYLLAGVAASGYGHLDHKNILSSPALIVDEESGQRDLYRRMKKLVGSGLISPTADLHWHTLPRFNPFDPRDIDWLHREVQETGARLVIIDAWVDILNGRDENSSSQVQPGIMALRDVAELCDTTIIVIHHISKTGGFGGSTALKDGVDWMLQIEEQPKLDPGARRLFTIKNRHGPKAQVLCQMDFDPDGLTGFAWLGKVTMVQSDSKKREPTPQALWVMSQLLERGRTSKSVLRSVLPEIYTPTQLTNAIKALVRWEWVAHLNKGATGGDGIYNTSRLTIKEWEQFTETDETDEVEEEEANGELE